MNLYQTILSRRTIRRFKQIPLGRKLLRQLVEAGRRAPSAANLQPLEFLVIDKPALRDSIFRYLRWAAYIHPRGIPQPGEQPVAYVLVLINTQKGRLYSSYDAAASIENIILAAWSKGAGSCWIRSMRRSPLRRLLRLPPHLVVDSCVALGYPHEKPALEEIKGEDVKYWKDKKGRLHVPKRRLSDILFFNGYPG